MLSDLDLLFLAHRIDDVDDGLEAARLFNNKPQIKSTVLALNGSRYTT